MWIPPGILYYWLVSHACFLENRPRTSKPLLSLDISPKRPERIKAMHLTSNSLEIGVKARKCSSCTTKNHKREVSTLLSSDKQDDKATWVSQTVSHLHCDLQEAKLLQEKKRIVPKDTIHYSNGRYTTPKDDTHDATKSVTWISSHFVVTNQRRKSRHSHNNRIAEEEDV